MVKKIRNINLLILIFYTISCVGANFSISSEARINKAIKAISDEKYTQAKQDLEYIIFNDPISKYANIAHYYLAEAQFHSKDYPNAILEYKKYLKLPRKELELSLKAEYMICKCWFNLCNDVKRDQTNTFVALDKLQYYIVLLPVASLYLKR